MCNTILTMNIAKINAAEKFLSYLEPGMVVGLGSGTTVETLMKLIYHSNLSSKLQFSYSSLRTNELANAYNLKDAEPESNIDIMVDSADLFLKTGELIKGLGGALFREKILAKSTDKYFIIVEEAKIVNSFENHIIPIEISSFNPKLTVKEIVNLGGQPILRPFKNEIYLTDNQNFIVDTVFKKIPDLKKLANQIKSITGVIEHGLFLDFKPTLIIGSNTDKTLVINTSIS